MDRGAWRATVQGGRKESDMTERLILSLFFRIWSEFHNPHNTFTFVIPLELSNIPTLKHSYVIISSNL